jgi:hypothetical protein
MEKIIKETTEKLNNRTITLDEANKILLDLFGVIRISNKCNDCNGKIDKEGICFCNR